MDESNESLVSTFSNEENLNRSTRSIDDKSPTMELAEASNHQPEVSSLGGSHTMTGCKDQVDPQDALKQSLESPNRSKSTEGNRPESYPSITEVSNSNKTTQEWINETGQISGEHPLGASGSKGSLAESNKPPKSAMGSTSLAASSKSRSSVYVSTTSLAASSKSPSSANGSKRSLAESIESYEVLSSTKSPDFFQETLSLCSTGDGSRESDDDSYAVLARSSRRYPQQLDPNQSHQHQAAHRAEAAENLTRERINSPTPDDKVATASITHKHQNREESGSEHPTSNSSPLGYLPNRNAYRESMTEVNPSRDPGENLTSERWKSVNAQFKLKQHQSPLGLAQLASHTKTGSWENSISQSQYQMVPLLPSDPEAGFNKEMNRRHTGSQRKIQHAQPADWNGRPVPLEPTIHHINPEHSSGIQAAEFHSTQEMPIASGDTTTFASQRNDTWHHEPSSMRKRHEELRDSTTSIKFSEQKDAHEEDQLKSDRSLTIPSPRIVIGVTKLRLATWMSFLYLLTMHIRSVHHINSVCKSCYPNCGSVHDSQTSVTANLSAPINSDESYNSSNNQSDHNITVSDSRQQPLDTSHCIILQQVGLDYRYAHCMPLALIVPLFLASFAKWSFPQIVGRSKRQLSSLTFFMNTIGLNRVGIAFYELVMICVVGFLFGFICFCLLSLFVIFAGYYPSPMTDDGLFVYICDQALELFGHSNLYAGWCPAIYNASNWLSARRLELSFSKFRQEKWTAKLITCWNWIRYIYTIIGFIFLSFASPLFYALFNPYGFSIQQSSALFVAFLVLLLTQMKSQHLTKDYRTTFLCASILPTIHHIFGVAFHYNRIPLYTK